MRVLWGAAILAIASLSPARADFVLQSAPAVPPSEPALPRTAPRPLNIRLLPRFPLASGFGSQVPLAFAVRQIVPAAVRVRYADGVDQAALVDWTGGKAWNETVRAAVKPLGLHVQATPTALSISP